MSAQMLRKIMPLGDRVLVKKLAMEAKTPTGVFLPQSAVQSINQAEVIAVGKGIVNSDGVLRQLTLKAGDKVIVPEFGGVRMKVNDEELICFREDDIVGTIHD